MSHVFQQLLINHRRKCKLSTIRGAVCMNSASALTTPLPSLTLWPHLTSLWEVCFEFLWNSIHCGNIVVSFSLSQHVSAEHLLCVWACASPGQKEPQPLCPRCSLAIGEAGEWAGLTNNEVIAMRGTGMGIVGALGRATWLNLERRLPGGGGPGFRLAQWEVGTGHSRIKGTVGQGWPAQPPSCLLRTTAVTS